MYGGYGANNAANYGMDDGAVQMANVHMGGMGLGAGLAGLGIGFGMSPNAFFFMGNSLSLRTRLESLTDEEIQKFTDAHISVSGQQVQSMNMWSYMCTLIWGSIILFPLFLMCMGCWKKCTYPAFSVDASTYQSLGRILRGSNLKNMTLIVTDNTFDAVKANILYNSLLESRVGGFSFNNNVGEYDFNNRQYSDFARNMRPIKSLTNIVSEIRWGTQLVV